MSRSRECKHKAVAVAVALFVLVMPGTGEAEVRLEASPDTATSLVQAIREQITAAPFRVASLDVRVTIGTAAFRTALDNQDGRPIVAAYISSTEFAAVLGDRPRPSNVTAIFSNPDPIDQFVLARQILGKASVGVFDSANVHPLVERLTSVGVTAIHVSPNESVDSLLRSTDPYDVIIALPDPSVLTGANIGHVVRTLYQQHKVLIGYSDKLTQVGSLASVYPTAEEVARAVGQVLDQYSANRAIPAPVFVPDVDVSLNERLAASLNIILPTVADLTAAIRSKHRGSP